MVFPEIAVTENFFDNLFFLDKRDNADFAIAWFGKLTTGLGHLSGSTS